MKLHWLALLVVTLVVTACGPKHVDLSQLSAQGLKDYQAALVVEQINNADNAAMTANRGKVTPFDSDAVTKAFLTVTQQARDYIRANPQGTRAQIITAIREAKDAFPSEVREKFDASLQTIITFIGEVQ